MKLVKHSCYYVVIHRSRVVIPDKYILYLEDFEIVLGGYELNYLFRSSLDDDAIFIRLEVGKDCFSIYPMEIHFNDYQLRSDNLLPKTDF